LAATNQVGALCALAHDMRAALVAGSAAALALTLLTAPAAAPEPADLTWSVTAVSRGPDTPVRVLPVREFDRTVDTVSAAVPGHPRLAVDVRGMRDDGTWTEWIEAAPLGPAVLPSDTDSVQVRLVYSEGPRPATARADLRAWRSDRARATVEQDGEAVTYQVFATREGLVGETTANGHRIAPLDHFVALPSRRGLSTRGTGEYTVRVCTTDGRRCEWAPVWDVGPWNTRDAYWTREREQWPELPRGLPQAQAAYFDGHNGGRDGSGRQVLNPAGIDLADGTFWDGLRLRDNAWVEVTYSWTGSGPWGTVETLGDTLDVRNGPERSSAQVGLAANRAQVRISCHVRGDPVVGSQGRSDRWFRLAPGMYVSAAFVRPGITPPAC
jgi:hypothetical protein